MDKLNSEHIEQSWYARAFGPLYTKIYAHRSIHLAEAEVDFAVQALQLTDSDCVLDLCCGAGRHLYHLRSVTRKVFGLDYSEELLRRGLNDVGLRGLVVRGDMRAIPFGECFDVVVNFFTSFGYFFSDEENQEVLAEVSRVLKKGGRFLFDHLNATFVEKYLIPQTRRKIGTMRVIETRWIDQNRINKRIEIFHKGSLVDVIHESVRLFSPQEFVDLFSRCGLEIQRFFGYYNFFEFCADSPRMIAVGIKK